MTYGVAIILACVMTTATAAQAIRAKAEYLALLQEKSARIAERSLRDYVKQAWPIVEPSTVYRSNWHIDAICDHLEAVTRGEIKRLLINIPPRHMKSLTVGVFWPTWEWVTRPERRWLTTSYRLELALRDTVKSRRLIESPWYQERWSHVFELSGDQNAKGRYENTRSGYRLAGSVGSGITGEGGDVVVCDDPHNVADATSDAMRRAALDWWDQTMSTRLNDPTTGALVVVMQRVHEDDLSGHILNQGGYEHLCLPAEYEPQRRCVTVLGDVDRRARDGELLWPERFDEAALIEAKTRLGSYGAAGQLQQRPAPAAGGLFRRSWWRYYQDGRPPAQQHLLVSVDPALRDKQVNDWAAIQTWGAAGPNRYLLRAARGHWGEGELEQQIRDMYRWALEKFPGLGVTVLIEATAAGPDVIARLRRIVPGVIAVRPTRDKVQRAHAVTPIIEAGNVFLPGAASPDGNGPDIALTPGWAQDVIDECAAFPFGANDDQVDALTQALARLETPRAPAGSMRLECLT